MKINVNDKSKAEKVPVTVAPRKVSLEDIAQVLRKLDATDFKLVIRSAKQMKKCDRWYDSALESLYDS